MHISLLIQKNLDEIALDNSSAPDKLCVLVDGVGPDNAISG